MPHETPLLATLAAGFGLAFLFGLAAVRAGLPSLVGYLLAGVALGPFSRVHVADVRLGAQLAEVGVILLLFGVGLHFTPGDLLRVRRVAVPGALAQMAVSAALGTVLARAWGWSAGAALVFGLTLCVSSTVVVLRALESRGGLDSAEGRTAVGWLVVEDLVMALVLVLLPAAHAAFADPAAADGPLAAGPILALGGTLAKVVAFGALMVLVGRRAVPWLLTHVARTGSRELFTLAVLVVALGVAIGAASLFGMSVALGAFVAGVVISESDVSYKAAADALPFQDAFAVLFFVSVGMLFDPAVLVQAPLRVAATVGVVLVGNALAATVLLVALGQRARSAIRLGASLGQIGEFSFILAALGVSLGVLPEQARSLVLAAALLTIALNPALGALGGAADRWLAARPAVLDRIERRHAGLAVAPPAGGARPERHVVLVGHGRVGRTVGEALGRAGIPFVVVEQDRRVVEALRASGTPTVYGDATRPGILAHAHPESARLLVVATPEPYHGRQVVALARAANAAIDVVVRTHRDEEQASFERIGVGLAVMGERELARGMARYALRAFGRDDRAADASTPNA